MPYTDKKTQLKNYLKQFAFWLQSSRKSRGLTQDALADISEIDQGLISKYERATLQCPRRTVYALAAALSGTSADERIADALLNAGLRAAGFAGTDEYLPRPMMTFVEQRLRESPDGVVHELTPEQADQLASELEEMADLRITQVRRQSPGSQLQGQGG